MRIFILIFTFIFALSAWAFSPSDLRAFGQKAPVQLYLFTSLTCPHCSDFHKKILPAIKKEYANTGKAQVIIVDMVSSENGLMATQTVRCLDGQKADQLEDELYTRQSKWRKKNGQDAKKIIASYAAAQGMDKNAFDLCIGDKELQKSILEQQANLSRLYDVNATPTLVMREGAEVRKWSGSDKNTIMNGLKEAFQK